MAWIERGYSLSESAVVAWKNLNPAGLGAGFVGAIFSIAGPGLIVMSAAQAGNLDPATATSWLCILYLTGGLYSIFYALRYRLPVVAAYSIPGAIIIGKSFSHLSINEAVGSYYIVAVLVALLSVTGLIEKAINHLPLPIMLGMIAGVLMSFGIGLIDAIKLRPALVGPPVVVFFALLAYRSFSRRVPPILGAILVGGFLVTYLGLANWQGLRFELARPVFFWPPAFSVAAFFELAIPLTVLAVGVQNVQAVGVLMAEGYKPLPINALFTIPAIGTVQNALFAGHPCVTAGPSTAICSSAAAGEDKSLRFIAAISEGICYISFSLVAGMAIAAAGIVPKEITAMLAGLAMFDVLISAFGGAFSGRFKAGALVSFLVAVSNITLWNVGAPFWALVCGLAFSLVLEQDDFAKQRASRAKVD